MSMSEVQISDQESVTRDHPNNRVSCEMRLGDAGTKRLFFTAGLFRAFTLLMHIENL